MAQTQTINTPQDYVNYTFNIEARGVAEVSSELMGLSNTVGNILGQIAFKTSEFLSHTDMLAIGTGAAISAMFVSATKDAIHFQQQIANVQAIGGEAINAQDIGNAAMEFSNKFGMATASMTEGLEALARAGITSTSVMKEVLAEGVKLSKLEGLDLEDSINDLISTTNLLSQEGVDMNDPNYGQMVQAMNQRIVSTSESAPINAQNIIQSLQHVGGYASASGMDQEDLFAVIAQLGSRGTKGEMAGTALRAFIAAGQKDTAQRALARIGLNVSDLWNQDGETMLSISEMKDVLDNALEARGYSKQEKLEFYSDFAGYKQANQIMKIDTSEVQQYKESIANAWDLGKKLDVILGTVRGNLDRIWQTTQNFMTKVGSNLLNIMSAILTPVRIFLDIITKIPFADKAVAAGMIFVAFRTGLMIFNKLVPAIAGFMSGISDASDETRGLRSEWTKTREEIEKAKDIIFLLKNKDQEGLAKKHYEEHGLSARNKAFAENVIAGQMYMGSNWYKEHGRIPWRDLDDPVKDMIAERFKGTKAFKQNYSTYVDRTRNAVNEITSEPIIIEDFENEDTLEAINSYVQEIFQLLNSDRTRGQTDNIVDNDDNGSQDNRRRNAQARTLSNIFNNRVQDSTYGNVNFKYARTEEGYADAKAGLKAAYDDLRKYTKALSNTNSDNINSIQRSAYKKLFTTTVSERGQEATKTANESEIRLIFEKGQLESHENDYEGIKDSQVEYIAKKLNLDDFRVHDYEHNDRRAEFAQAVHEAIQNISEDRRQAIIDEIINGTGDDAETKGTNKLWEESLDKIAIGRKNFLSSKPQIASSIISQISNINTTGYNSNTEAVLDYFNGLDDSHEDWNIAIKTAMDVLKGDSQYSKIEENTIKYIADNIQRHKETILSYQADAETLGFSEGVRNEIEDVLNDMRNDEALLRQGGSLLGEAIVSGFIGDGLGRHSPGYMFWALVDEQTDINKAILQSRGLLNKNAGLLGLEMTETFNNNLGFDRVFDSGIEYLRRDSDVIKDIIDNFNKDEFRTDDEQDLEYDLLPMQIDAQDGMYAIPKVMQDFVQPYGFDVSNYQRFGTNFGTSIDSITQFESILWFTQTHSEFDLDKMFDSGLFDEDDIYDYLDLLTEAFHEDKTWSYFKLKKDHDIDPSIFDSMNKFIEDYYFNFLAIMSQEMSKTIINAPGLYNNVRLYRGGRLPVGNDGLGEYLGTTSTSYTKRIADLYTYQNGAVNHSANLYAPEGTLGAYLNRQQFGDRKTIIGSSIGDVFDNQIEYVLGSGQPFIELPNEETGQLSNNLLRNEGDVLLLEPGQIADVQQVVVDEVSDMLNSGRADSHILNLAGINAVNNLVSLKTKENSEKVNSNSKKTNIPPQKGPGYSAAMDAPIEDKFNNMVENVLNYFKETSAMGRTYIPHGPFDYNPTSTRFDNIEQISTFIHEMTHLLRNQYERSNLSPIDPNYIPLTFTTKPVGSYNISHFKEWEAEYVEYHTLKKLGMKTSKIAERRMNEHAQFLKDEGYSQYMHHDDLDAMVDFFVQNIEDVVGYIDNFIYDISKYSKGNYQVEYGDNIATWQRTKDLIKNPQSKYTKILPSINDIVNTNLSNRQGYLEIGANDDNIIRFQDYFTARRGDYLAAHPRAKGDAKTVLKEFETKEDDILKQYGILITRGERLLNIKNKEAAETAYLSGDVSFKKMLNIQKKYDTGYHEGDLLRWGYYNKDKDAITYYNKKDKEMQKEVALGNLSQGTYDRWKYSIENYTPSNVVDWHNYFKHDYGYGADITYTGQADDEFFDYINHYLPRLILEKNKDKKTITPKDMSEIIKDETDFIGRELYALVRNIKTVYKLSLPFNGDEFVNPLYEKPKEFAMPGVLANIEYINYTNDIIKEQEEALKLQKQIIEYQKQNAKGYIKFYTKEKEQIEQQMQNTIDNQNNLSIINEYQKQNAEGYIEFYTQQEKEKQEQNEQAYFDSLSNFDKARVTIGYTGTKSNRFLHKGINFADKYYNKTIDTVSGFANTQYQKSQEYAKEHGHDNLDFASEKIDNAIKETKQFQAALSDLSEIFPQLTPAVMALDTALQIQEGVSWGLKVATDVLTFAKTGETESTFLQTMANWANSESALQAAAGEMVLAGVTWLASAAEATLAFIRGLSTGQILLIVGAIATVVAAIMSVKFWEESHAKALEASRKELEENTARNNIALSQYKDLKKARENETDAMKKQQVARKEAIALYELEASRIKKRKAVQDEAKLRNDAIWGEYGLRASLQKMGLGFIAGGDFQSQYENYDGTTANIRKIKEDSLGNLFATREQNYVASVYDKNSNFFAEVEAYKEPLQELYDKESKLIEQYGSIDNARASKEFYEAVKEFSDATGINGETAGKMLDWLETENKVNQATKVGQAQIGVIRARADAKVAALEYGEGGDLNDMNTLGNAMVLAQFQEMMNTAKTEVWWELLFAYLDALISIILPWKWGDVGKNLATIGIRQEELSELDAEGNNILNSMYEQYENAERKDYGAGISYVSDTPFGGAIASASAEYADKEQDRLFTLTGKTMSEDAYLATQDQYSEDTYGITNEKLKQQKFKEDKEAYEKNKAQKQINKSKDTLGQLQNNGEQAHQDALDIIDAIKNPGVISGLGAGINKLLDDELIKSVGEFSLNDMFAFMRGESGTFTERIKNTYAEDGLKGLYNKGKSTISEYWNGELYGREGLRSKIASRTAPYNRRAALTIDELWSGKAAPGSAVSFKDGKPVLHGERISGGLKGILNDIKNTYAEDGLKGLYNKGKSTISEYWNGIPYERTGLKTKIKSSTLYKETEPYLYKSKDIIDDLIYGKVQGATGAIMKNGRPVPLGGERTGGLKGIYEGAKGAYSEGGWRSLGQYGKSLATESVEKIKGISPNTIERAKSAVSRGKDFIKGTGTYGRVTDRISLAREANALAADGVPIARNGIDKAVGFADNAKAAYANDGLKGLANFGKTAGKDGMKGLANVGKTVSTELGGTKEVASRTASGMKDLMNPKALSSGVDDIARGLKGGGTLMKGMGKVGGRALAFLGPALAFAGKASELNPFEGKHYNEDGTEKKALQATGEVVGTTAGALGGVAGGIAGASEGAIAGAAIGSVVPVIGTAIGGAIGAVAGGIAGGWLGDTIFQPIGEVIGGTIGWLGDNLLGGIQNVAGTVWDGLTGAAGGVWNAVSGAASGAWDMITGANDESNNPVKGLLGLTPIGMGINAAAGISDWLSGGNEPKVNYGEGVKAGKQAKEPNGQGNTIVIKNININTEDDPEKIKSALMHLIVEMQEQIAPRTVSRTIGQAPNQTSQTTNTTQNPNDSSQAEGTDQQNGANNNQNPTI